jgi:hypothetical protein
LRGAQSKDPEGLHLTQDVGIFSSTKIQARVLELEKVRKTSRERFRTVSGRNQRGGTITGVKSSQWKVAMRESAASSGAKLAGSTVSMVGMRMGSIPDARSRSASSED